MPREAQVPPGCVHLRALIGAVMEAEARAQVGLQGLRALGDVQRYQTETGKLWVTHRPSEQTAVLESKEQSKGYMNQKVLQSSPRRLLH